MRRDVLCLLSSLPANVVWGSVGKRKNTESAPLWVFFSTIFLFKTVGKMRILNNAQNQMKQSSQKSTFNSEMLPLQFSTGTWGIYMLPISNTVSSHQIFPQEIYSFKEVKCCKMGVLHLAMPCQILPASWGKGSMNLCISWGAFTIFPVKTFWLSMKYVSKIFCIFGFQWSMWSTPHLPWRYTKFVGEEMDLNLLVILCSVKKPVHLNGKILIKHGKKPLFLSSDPAICKEI